MPMFQTADGASLSYTDRGPSGGLPLLFLHGWQVDSAAWFPVAERLAARHRTIALDLRGFGASNGAPGPYRIETFADDLSALVAALDLDPLVAIGHSMGGAVAQRFAIDRPDAVEALVLAAPIPAGGVQFSPKLDALLRATAGNPANAAAWLAQLTHRPPTSDIVASLRRAAAAARPDVLLESYDSWTGSNFAAEAATIETPTLVIAPALDRPMTPAFLRERVAAIIAGSRVEVIEEAAHLVQLDQPDSVARAIERFIIDL